VSVSPASDRAPRWLHVLAAALAACLALGTTAAAAQALTSPQMTVMTKRAGDAPASKRANTALAFSLRRLPANATVETVTLQLPSWLKVSGRGLPRCKRSLTDVWESGAAVCPRAYAANPGRAYASFSPGESVIDLYLRTLLRDVNTLWIWASDVNNPVTFVFVGEVSNGGRAITFHLPDNVRHPVPGTDATFVSWKLTLGYTNRRSVVRSSRCQADRTATATITFAERDSDDQPVPAPIALAATVDC
jgi:hypothetical protein